MGSKEDRIYSDQEILEGLVRQDRAVLTFLYRQFYPKVAHYVLKHGGQEEDAEDVFQEALIILFRKASDLRLTSRLLTYFMAIGRRIWWNRMRDFKKRPLPLQDDLVPAKDDELIEIIEKAEQYQLFRDKFSLLGSDCQRLLTLFFAGKSMQEISETMGLSSIGYTKKRKYLCKNKLVEMVKEDPRYKEMITKL